MLLNLKKKLYGIVLAISFVFVVFVLIPMQQTDAQAGIPFGGVIANVTYCTCSFNTLLTIAGPSSGNLVFQPGVSIPFPYGQVYRPGPFVLGTYAPGGTCLLWVGKFCVPLPATGTIIMIGTSL